MVVFAAASLTEAFNKIGVQFKAKYPGLDVKFSYAGSPTLVTQIQQGAPADVFASADQPNMQKVTDAPRVEPPKVFATNMGEIMVEGGNPKHITDGRDLANPALKVDVCAPGVPCGTADHAVFNKAGVR